MCITNHENDSFNKLLKSLFLQLSPKIAIRIVLIILVAVIIFHLLVLTGIIPYSIVWAGKLTSVSEMRNFESVSILINLLFISVFLIKSGLLRTKMPPKYVRGLIWTIAAVFALNTLANLFSKNPFELYFFTSLTLVLTLLSVRIAIGNGQAVS